MVDDFRLERGKPPRGKEATGLGWTPPKLEPALGGRRKNESVFVEAMLR